ncbi:MAG TPA: MFS transporter [Streptosporangiaceae bacterium]|nr:MFS transporter [Streptosporangiaceae bacterium]
MRTSSFGPAGMLRRFYALRVVGTLANQLLQFAIPVLVYTKSGSVGWSGISLFLEWLPRLTSLPLAGPLVDRLGVRRVYVVNDIVRCVTAAGATVVATVLRGTAAIAAIVVLGLVAGSCFEQTFIAEEKAVRLLASPAQMPRAQSVLGGIDQAMLLIAPAIGGLLLAIASNSTIAAAAILFAVSLLLIWRLPVLSQARMADGWPSVAEVFSDVRAGAKRVLGQPVLRDVLALTSLINLLLGLVLAATPPVLIGVFRLRASQVGVLYTVGGSVSLVMLALTPRLIRRFGLLAVGAASTLCCGAAIWLAGLVHAYLPFAAFSAAFLAGESVFTVFIRTVRARVIPAAEYGTATGVIVLIGFLTLPLAGLLVAGFSRTSWPLSLLYVIAGGATFILALGILAHLSRLMPRANTARSYELVHALGDETPNEL